jgi:mono/diheme cytochrome c family protein
MLQRFGWFVLGVIAAILTMVAGAYLFLKVGGVSMETTAKQFPLEKTLVRLALHASIGNAAQQRDPLPFNDGNMTAGADIYKEHCAFCHGLPQALPTFASRGMFPRPPQLFEQTHMLTGKPAGITYWKVTHGIRLSGMPGFGSLLSDTQRWQITMLVAHADKLPPAARAALSP